MLELICVQGRYIFWSVLTQVGKNILAYSGPESGIVALGSLRGLSHDWKSVGVGSGDKSAINRLCS